MAASIPHEEKKTSENPPSMSNRKRDQPLFTSRHHHPPSHQPPDFFTESLNASSYTSSPNKGNLREGGGGGGGGGGGRARGAKSRRILGTPRGLAASFKATATTAIAENHDDQFPFSSASSSEGRQTFPTSISRPSQAGRSKSMRDLLERSSRRRKTPSPDRGRQPLIASPSSSASSPPRGLAEAYQRINDEESLAQEDSMEDDVGSFNYTGLEQSAEGEQTYSQQLQDAESPTPLNLSRKGSPRRIEEAFPPERSQEREMEDNSHESGDESGSFNPENTTDNSFAVNSSQYAKDLQRVHGALNSDARAFRKGRLGNRVGLTVENLSRRNGSNDSLGSPLGGGSGSSKGSDPSVNIPREWGRKARPGNDWLNRINSKSGKYTGDVSKRQRANQTIPEKRDGAEPLHEWVNTVPDVSHHHPSGLEHRSLSSPESTPTTSMQNMSLERVADWEINDDDFTGRSLQISDSPPIRIRTNTLDRVLDREIDSVAKRAVTTNRLDQIRERTPEERLKGGLQTRSAENLPHQGDVKGHQTPQQRRSSLKFQLRPEVEGKSEQFSSSMAALGDEGDPIPDSPVVVYRSPPDVSTKENEVEDIKANVNEISSHQPNHSRHDSRDLLRQLARATSQSPTPTKEEKLAEISGDSDKEHPTQPDGTPSKETRKTVNPPKTIGNKNGDINSSRVPKRVESDKVIQTPQLSRSKLDMKTPLVTGAWIDTPLPTGGGGPPLPTPANLDDENDVTIELGGETRKVAATDLIRKLNPKIFSKGPELKSRESLKDKGPLIPKSALESIISAAKSHTKGRSRKRPNLVNADSDEDPTLLLGESTIQSLEEILDDDTNTPKLYPPSQQSSGTQSDNDPSDDEDLADPQKSSLSTVQSQISRLDNVGPSIRDAKRRLAFLERAVSKSKSSSLIRRRMSFQEQQCDEGGEIHDFVWPCEKCGNAARRAHPFSSTATDSLATISITIPKLWRWHDDDWRPRLTWLGWAVLAWWGYLIADRIACNIYCHPLYATTMEGYGVDINSPEPPFVLFQVLYRILLRDSFLGTLLSPIYYIVSLLLSVVSSMVGYLVGFIFGGDGDGANGMGNDIPVSSDERIPRPQWAPDLSMMNDEYL